MNNKDFKIDSDNKIIVLIATIVVFILICILIPCSFFIIGLMMGYAIKIIFGSAFVAGLEMLNIHIAIDSIPAFCATISVLGSLFNVMHINTK